MRLLLLRRLLVRRQKNFFSFLFVTLLLVSCGGTDSTNTVPQAADPNAGATTPLPTVTVPTDGRLPEWVANKRYGNIIVPSVTDYSNLEAIFGLIYPPVVGTPIIAMDIASDRTTNVSGKLYLGVEDDKAFTYREWTSLESMSARSSTVLDGWFLDDEMVVRVNAGISAGKVSGQIQFRKRVSGENQCVPSTVQYCSAWHSPAYYAPGYCGSETNEQCFQRTGCQRDTTNSNYVWCCNTYSSYESLDTTACSNYMGANPSVKTLGTFEAVYSKWLK